ncbi:NAD(P)H-binding protein [uncultured Roseibium sp.]|uniref:NAD(P)H-binding protein n=1 Tax=uncultured Roseibium sp. TaxID=1936171 RepID=UPI0026057409|nr:NAD(P)H-binding protein [uncultured Roseibium sp.]
MLIVTGATGQLGRRIVEHLLSLVPAGRLGVSVRDPDRARDLSALGIRVRRGNYTDLASLLASFEGAERILLVSSNAAATGGDPLAQHSVAIAAAKQVGAERLLYTSQVSASDASQFPPGRDHAATERMLEASGLAWTALRHGFYAASALMINARGFADGLLAVPQDGKVAWTTHDDLAAADAAMLAGVEEVDGPTPPLAAGEALDLADLAALASGVLGKPVTRDVLGDEAWMSGARARGMPERAVEIMMGYFRAARAGEFAATDPMLERLIGRPAASMRTFLQENLQG